MRQHPQHRLEQLRDHVSRLQARSTNSLTQRLRLLNSSLGGLARTLDALSPLHTVARGYSILTDTEGHALTRTTDLHTGQRVRARMQDGEASLLAEGITRAEQ